jgi:oligopeptide/dipeptide ABC transporter ATP-binding protein
MDINATDPHGEVIRSVRGGEIAMIFQEPMTSLSPVFTIGSQIVEAIRLHQHVSKTEARTRAIDALANVGIPEPQTRFGQYQHQLSGGMRQRVMIAMALSCNPSLLIADEPTTALDVTTQAQVLELMTELRNDFQMAMMLITHDLGVVAETADDVAVMYLGQVVEHGPVRRVLRQPRHPYTEGLLRSVPVLGQRAEGRRLTPISGVVPDARQVPTGCRFAPRCPYRMDQCTEPPPMIDLGHGHQARCWLLESAQTDLSSVNGRLQ